MIENNLTDALIAKITEVVGAYRMPVKNGETRPPKVIDGYLPPKRSGADDDFPFVLVRADSGNSDMGKTEVEVAIIIGCYAEDFDGHKYCLNVMTRIRDSLMSMNCATLAGKYQLQYPIRWDIVPEQPWPQWQLDMTTKWVFNSPQMDF